MEQKFRRVRKRKVFLLFWIFYSRYMRLIWDAISKKYMQDQTICSHEQTPISKLRERVRDRLYDSVI